MSDTAKSGGYYTLKEIADAALVGGLDGAKLGRSLAVHANHNGGLGAMPHGRCLRDEIALEAMKCMLGKIGIDDVGPASYRLADAMLTSREKTNEH